MATTYAPYSGAQGLQQPAQDGEEDEDVRRRRAAIVGGVIGAGVGAAGIIGAEAGRSVAQAQASELLAAPQVGDQACGSGITPSQPPQPLAPGPGQQPLAGENALPAPPGKVSGRTLRISSPLTVGVATGVAALIVVAAGYLAVQGDRRFFVPIVPIGKQDVPTTSTATPPSSVALNVPPSASESSGSESPSVLPPPAPGQLMVSVRFAGKAGRVSSTDGRISCPGSCIATYTGGQRVRLVASGAGFLGWSSCSWPDGASCTVSGTGTASPLARFREAVVPTAIPPTTPSPTPTPTTPSPTPTPTTPSPTPTPTTPSPTPTPTTPTPTPPSPTPAPPSPTRAPTPPKVSGPTPITPTKVPITKLTPKATGLAAT